MTWQVIKGVRLETEFRTLRRAKLIDWKADAKPGVVRLERTDCDRLKAEEHVDQLIGCDGEGGVHLEAPGFIAEVSQLPLLLDHVGAEFRTTGVGEGAAETLSCRCKPHTTAAIIEGDLLVVHIDFVVGLGLPKAL